MNVEFVNPILESMLNVLATMAQLEARPGKPALKDGDVSHGEVSGIIGMVGARAKGSVAISFTRPVIFDIVRRMVGEEPTTIDETVTDLVGEITNMVSGGAMRILGERGYVFDMALPAVVSGKNHLIHHRSKGQKIILPFAVDTGEFFVELCFEN